MSDRPCRVQVDDLEARLAAVLDELAASQEAAQAAAARADEAEASLDAASAASQRQATHLADIDSELQQTLDSLAQKVGPQALRDTLAGRSAHEAACTQQEREAQELEAQLREQQTLVASLQVRRGAACMHAALVQKVQHAQHESRL